MIRFYQDVVLSPTFKNEHIKLTYDFLNHNPLSIDDGLKKLLNYYCIADIMDYDSFICKLTNKYDVNEWTMRTDNRVGLPHQYSRGGKLEYQIKKLHKEYIDTIIEFVSPNIIKCLVSGSLLACKTIDGNSTWNTVYCKKIMVSVYIGEDGEIYD